MTVDKKDTEPIPRLEATWPYLADEVERTLNPALIEYHGRQILARGATHGRLVAFVGAGVSMAYGRLSWSDLVQRVLEEVAKAGSEGLKRGAPDEVISRIQALVTHLDLLTFDPKRKPRPYFVNRDQAAKLKGLKPLLVFQFCSEILASAQKLWPRSKIRSLEQIFNEELESPKGHDKNLVDIVKASLATSSVVQDLRNQHAFGEGGGEETEPLAPRRHFLQILRAYKADVPAQLKELLRDLSRHENGSGSPIATLVNHFHVRRFATTNYDNEIEAALQRAGYQEAREGPSVSPIDFRQASIILGLSTASNALAFGVEGRRRHAQVLHLHGRINHEDSIIASERDYQRLYLRHSKQRDLLDNAIRTLFGANPVLYIGSGISEEDVLRPLREFMSRAPRRDDRLGVALLPANDHRHELALQKIECLARYGIHVIHYGYERGPSADAPSGTEKPTESWLSRLTQLARAFKARLAITSGSSGSTALRWPQDLGQPATLEGEDCSSGSAFAIDLEFSLLKHLITTFGGRRVPLDAPTTVMLSHLTDEIVSSIMTAFVCARLQAEIRFRERWAAGLGRPAEPVRTGPLQGESPPSHYSHMTPELDDCRGGGRSRFVSGRRQLAAHDQRWQQLGRSIRRHPRFLRRDGRRVVLLAFQRGAGKGSMFEQLCEPESRRLRELKRSLKAGIDPEQHWRTAVINLNFLSDVSNLAQAITRVICPEPERKRSEGFASNVVAALEHALLARTRQLPEANGEPERVLLVLGNAGALFDRSGEPKNGQVLRLLTLLSDPRFRRAPVDIVMLCDDEHIPAQFRSRPKPTDGPTRHREASAPPMWKLETDAGTGFERPNRLTLLGMRELRVAQDEVHIHVPARNRAVWVAYPFLRPIFPGVLEGPGWRRRESGKDLWEKLDGVLRELHDALSGNRIAMTLVLALAAEHCEAKQTAASPGPKGPSRELLTKAVTDFLKWATTEIRTQTHESAAQTALQLVLDGWQSMHSVNREVTSFSDVTEILHHCVGSSICARVLNPATNAMENLWRLSREILWHLSVLSHPVELSVLQRCPAILRMADLWLEATKVRAPARPKARRTLIRAVAELCVHRCLAVRMKGRNLGNLDSSSPPPVRYTVHRLVQRHFLRKMGGRNIEAVEWDQFTTSLYMSQPDETPSLSKEGHESIKELLDALSRYGKTSWSLTPPPVPATAEDVEEEYRALRAAYFVARSSYSVGVLSHIAASSPGMEPGQIDGHMEAYRRRIRWITHRAEALQEHSSRLDPDAHRGCGYFHKGEVVWLYAECGVMSLMQGKLEDAESLLNLAMSAAKRIESDDTGSLHVRLLLHIALARIERGRQRTARPLLEQIAQRREGHQVPPLIAEFYLGMIDHLGGEYHQAGERYAKSLQGFRQLGRTRATAFVLKAQADLLLATVPGDAALAMAKAHEAMAAAQRGGHEDVRILAALTLVRIRIKSKQLDQQADSFRLLDTVGLYGAEMGMPRMTCAAHMVRASLLHSQGEAIQSVREATASAEIAALYDLKLFKCKAMLTLAEILVLRGDKTAAEPIILAGLEMAHAAEYFTCVRGFRALGEGGTAD